MSKLTGMSFRDRAFRILSGREHSAWELRQKLLSKGCAEEGVQEIIADFVAHGYLDDVRFGVMLVREKVRQGWGSQHIKGELLRRGVRGDSLDSVLQECGEVFSPEAECERAEEVVKHRLHSPDDAERVFRYLVSHGYSSACALSVLEPYRQD